MSMQKLRGIRNTGAYTPQRSMLEHLLLLEAIILRETPKDMDVPTTRIFLAQHIQQYRVQHHISNPFSIEDIQNYFLTTTEQEFNQETSQTRGMHTSALIEQTEGDKPITIDMLGKNIDWLLSTINTLRHITINNTKGDFIGSDAGSYQGKAHLIINNTKGDQTGAHAGSNHGQAHLTINNTEGRNTGADAGSNQGTAYLTINNTNGDLTGAHAGYDQGRAHLTINNTKGTRTGAFAGSGQGKAYLIIKNTEGDQTGENSGFSGRAIIVAYNNQGEKQFRGNRGTLISHNPDQPPRIEGTYPWKRWRIRKLLAQNAPPEKIMAYLRGNT